MNVVKCPNCGCENKNTNIRCESCKAELIHIEQNDNFLNKDYSQTNVKTIKLGSKKIKFILNAILIFMFAPFILGGLIFTAVSSYSMISDYNKSKNYLETEGKLVSYDSCFYDDKGYEMCSAVYEYIVNGVIYKGSPDLLASKSEFQKNITVKYNPKNPNKYVMDSEWNFMFIYGIVVVVVNSLIFISIKKFLKRVSNKLNEEVKKDDQVTNT